MLLEVHDEGGKPLVARDIDAILFDLDGVVTDTAELHAKAWKKTFDEFLAAQPGSGSDENLRPFDIATDFPDYVNGKPREEGIKSFLQSRGLGLDSVQALADAKTKTFQELLEKDGVHVFPDALATLKTLKDIGMKTALVSSSRNSRRVMARASIEDYFDVLVDGNTVLEEGLQGKPAPDAFLEAARRLGVAAGRAVVVEDAIAGVQAGKRGNFALVAGVARHGVSRPLLENGADVVVSSIDQFDLPLH